MIYDPYVLHEKYVDSNQDNDLSKYKRLPNGKYIITGSSYYKGTLYNIDQDEYLNKIKYKNIPFRDSPQPYIELEDGNHYRARCELLVLNDKDELLIDSKKKSCKTNNNKYAPKIPGGGIDPYERLEISAKRETEEEAKITADDIKFMNIAWVKSFPNTVAYSGALSFVCVGRYKKQYKGYINVADRDNIVWKDWKSLNLIEPYVSAIENYLTSESIKEEFEIDQSFLNMNLL